MKKNQYVLTITLNPAIDKTIVIPHFKRGVIYRPEMISTSAGGKGINVSKVLSQLGINTLASGFLPQKGADFIKLELEQNQIKYRFATVKGEVRSNLTILNPTSKRATRIFEPGGTVKRPDLSEFKQRYKVLLKRSKAVVISGSNAKGIPNAFTGQLIDLAKQEGVLTVLDTSLEPFKLGIKRKPFMIKPNLQEAEGFLGVRLYSRSAIIKALKDFYKKGAAITALTDGQEGAYVFDGKKMFYAKPPKIEQKNPVGCGDAFVAGFMAAYLREETLSDCLCYGSACGCANAMSLNPGEISFGKVQKILRKMVILDLKKELS